MRPIKVIDNILKNQKFQLKKEIGHGKASPNIALVKYWGKRDEALHLPENSSLSITLPSKMIELTVAESKENKVIVNDQIYQGKHEIVKNNLKFLNLFFQEKYFFEIKATMNFAAASGLASSSAWYAALTLALNDGCNWQLHETHLSILARLGSGSACRSFWPGFVAWLRGDRVDGMDSHGVPLEWTWPELCLGILTLTDQPKMVSSRQGMLRCAQTSPFYSAWTNYAEDCYHQLPKLIVEKNFDAFGEEIERNALAMHAVGYAAKPPLIYSHATTWQAIEKVWQLRAEGLPIYFTQDAGANLILLFLQKDIAALRKHFPTLEIINVFSK